MKVFAKIKKRLSHYSWELAYGEYSEDILENGLNHKKVHVVKNPYKNKWFADPFILSDSLSELHLFVEEYDSNIKRGRIAHLTIDKNKDVITDCKIILDLPTHLSFPAIYTDEGRIFVHPENYQSGESTIYEYNIDKDLLENPRVLLKEPIADAIIEEQGGNFLMFATLYPNMNGCDLRVYKSDSFLGPYSYSNSLFYEMNSARMAGMHIFSKGRSMRLAQDCSDAYGKAVIIYDGSVPVRRLTPINAKYCGLHTFNVKDNTFVIDLKRRDFPILYALLNRIKHLL